MNNLFQKKRFTMHSGGTSDFKLECDALTQDDYDTLAFLVSRKFQFKECYGIPKGGLPFQKALEPYKNPDAKDILIVDDVLTTGNSFFTMKKELIEKGIDEKNLKGVTVFARGVCPDFVTPIFTLNKEFWQNE